MPHRGSIAPMAPIAHTLQPPACRVGRGRPSLPPASRVGRGSLESAVRVSSRPPRPVRAPGPPGVDLVTHRQTSPALPESTTRGCISSRGRLMKGVESTTVHFECDEDGVLLLTLNRPERNNPWTGELGSAVH